MSQTEMQGVSPRGRRDRLLVPLVRSRATFFALVVAWLGALLIFWEWWLRPEHAVGTVQYLVSTLVLIWTTIIPGYFVFACSGSVRPDPALPVPPGWRVAMVVTKAPSEPAELVQHTLRAMLAQRYSHDTWLADEDPTPEVIDWCREHGVHLSTRKGVAEYHQSTWPRRTKSKEGNLSYFYDFYGYAQYDFVVQLDADHVPAEGYLEAMLRPFRDPNVGYVSAPSICDSNAAESWSARGRLFAEGALHGVLQAGYSGRLAPLCIGSHYAVRTAALKAVGGLGPELAEDHSTSLIMNAGGWRGVHAIDAIAHGQGPGTFTDLVVQEFQWSRSLTMILLRYLPKFIARLPWRLKAHFLFAELWYPLFSLSMLTMVVIPIIAVSTRDEWTGVLFLDFLFRMSIVSITITATMVWIRRQGWFRPAEARIFAWESALFVLARWPWSLLGTLAAIADWIRGRNFGFRVTPKGDGARTPLPFVLVTPYLLISLASSLPVVLVAEAYGGTGFYAFCLFNSAIYLVVAVAIGFLNLREQGRWWPRIRGHYYAATVVAATLCLVVVGMVLRSGAAIEGLTWGGSSSLRTVQAMLTPGDSIDLTSPLVVRTAPGQKFSLGVYDPGHAFASSRNLAIEHVFVSWLDDNTTLLIQSDKYARERNRWLMVTVEPWPAPRSTADNLFPETNQGLYDEQIDRLCREMNSFGRPALIRWGHEMEVVSGRYPWAQPDAEGYVRAYRHFVDRCRQSAGSLYYVWSPHGDGDLQKYYPGRSYVDQIGLSVYSLPEFDRKAVGYVQPFATNFGNKYAKVWKYGPPVMVAELGVVGTAIERRRWLARAFSDVGEFPLLEGAVYFNAKDHPGAWPSVFAVPDWTLPANALRTRRD